MPDVRRADGTLWFRTSSQGSLCRGLILTGIGGFLCTFATADRKSQFHVGEDVPSGLGWVALAVLCWGLTSIFSYYKTGISLSEGGVRRVGMLGVGSTFVRWEDVTAYRTGRKIELGDVLGRTITFSPRMLLWPMLDAEIRKRLPAAAGIRQAQADKCNRPSAAQLPDLPKVFSSGPPGLVFVAIFPAVAGIMSSGLALKAWPTNWMSGFVFSFFASYCFLMVHLLVITSLLSRVEISAERITTKHPLSGAEMMEWHEIEGVYDYVSSITPQQDVWVVLIWAGSRFVTINRPLKRDTLIEPLLALVPDSARIIL